MLKQVFPFRACVKLRILHVQKNRVTIRKVFCFSFQLNHFVSVLFLHSFSRHLSFRSKKKALDGIQACSFSLAILIFT